LDEWGGSEENHSIGADVSEMAMSNINTDVLVVGAGPAGLTASALLAKLGVPSITVTKYDDTADSPRAHITNQRTVEVLRDLGIEQAVMSKAMPQDKMATQVFATSFSGMELSRLSTWGGGVERRGDYEQGSPCAMCNIPQHMLEPTILDAAKANGAEIRFGTELVEISQDQEWAYAQVRERQSGKEYVIRAKYVIAADGARSTVGSLAGFEYEGEVALGDAVSVWLKADLSKYTKHRSGALTYICPPGSEIWLSCWPCVNAWDEWNPFFLRYGRARGDASEAVLRKHISEAIGDPSIDFEIKKITRWQVNHMVASRYRKGRLFLAGDAAHRHPPANGLGSNTSIQDSYNLVWKLALVLQGKAEDTLLDSYNSERQPVGRQVIDRAIKSQKELLPWSDAVGLRPGATPDQAWENIRHLFGETDEGIKRRAAVVAALDGLNWQFNAHGVELGQRYISGALVSDGTPFPAYTRDPELYYHPTTHPGAYLPHVWLQRGAERVSTLDLADYSRFTLLTGVGGRAWVDAASVVGREFGLQIAAHSVGMRQSNDDVSGDWARRREIDDRGCILVRPDRFVAWRSHDWLADPVQALRDVLTEILDRAPARAETRINIGA
jgi:2,4-dichlorophenol 6-monooxygenase